MSFLKQLFGIPEDTPVSPVKPQPEDIGEIEWRLAQKKAHQQRQHQDETAQSESENQSQNPNNGS